MLLLMPLTAACESDQPSQSHDASAEDAHMAEKREQASTEKAADKAASAFGPDADVFEWRTGELELEPGQEQYLCYASTLTEDMTVNAFASEIAPFVHHLIFSRARAPEPEGFAECDVTFRNSWEPLFISGAGDTKLEFPEDAASVMTAGTQLVLQMHLLNTSDKPVSGTTLINMRRTSIENPRRVSTAVFGTAAVSLPANKESEVVGTCAVKQDIQLIAGFPHMHLLGTGLRFEIGKSKDKLEEVFKRDPYDFDNQSIEKLDVKLSAGDMARVSCTYNNTHDQTISYGESTLNEMCYFIGFAVDSRGGCLEVTPPVTKR
jgi:hypothetical protein